MNTCPLDINKLAIFLTKYGDKKNSLNSIRLVYKDKI